MNKRAFCSRCNKALAACICTSIQDIDNRYFLHILQDPSEENKAVGTARIVDLSLSRVKVSVGEVFDPLQFDLENCFLLFPDENALAINQLQQAQKINADSQFIILDGSWKKAYKLLMLNPFLQALPKISLQVDEQSQYRIRKSPREDGLSTVEAAYYLLSELEGSSEKFVAMLDVFNKMIDYQISRMPKHVYEKNYQNKSSQDPE